MSDKALRSAFPRCKAEAISFLEAASLVTCRKRNMLSGLKEERRGIRSNHSGTEFYFQEDSSHFFRFSPELFSLCRDYIGRPTHDRLAALRQAGRTSPKGERGGGTTWPASSFYLTCFPSLTQEIRAHDDDSFLWNSICFGVPSAGTDGSIRMKKWMMRKVCLLDALK